ncbi:LysR family transcriptional regulator substrate-binding protein [Neisseria dentiae]|uniref:LysR family transcriptional regulator substrate-binding protein n=1 Tax=Neisseria dentiae TaxID=194197 RepID=UPI00359F4C11
MGLTHLFQRYFQPLLIKLHRKYPHLEIGVVVSDSSHLETLLHNGVIDIALIQRPYNLEGYDCISFPAVNAVVVAHNSLLEGFNGDSIHLHDLGRFPLVLLRRINGTGTFEFLQDKLRKNGVNPNVIMHISQPNVILDWLESGVEAASLLPESEVRAEKLAHCRIIRLLPEVLIFFPTLVKLAATPEVGEILAVLEEGDAREDGEPA